MSKEFSNQRNSMISNCDIVDVPCFWYKLLAVNAVLAFLVYSALIMHTRISVDSLSVQATGMGPDVQLEGARFTNAIIGYILDALGVDVFASQKVFYVIAIIAVAVAVTLLTNVFANLIPKTVFKNVVLIDICMLLAFINPSFLLLLLFPETLAYCAAGCLLLSLSVLFFFKGNTGWRYYLYSGVALLFLLGVYQAYIGFYLAMVSLGTWLRFHYEDNLALACKRWALGFFLCLGCAILDLLSRKLFLVLGIITETVKATAFSLNTLLSNLHAVVEYQSALVKNGAGLYPSFFVPAFLVLTLLLLIYVLVRCCNRREAISLVIVLVVAYLGLWSWHYVEAESFFPARSNISLWGFTASLWLVFWLLLIENRTQTKSKDTVACIASKIGIAVYACFLFATVLVMEDLMQENVANTQQSLDDASEIQTCIDEAEESSGLTVSKIALCSDEQVTWRYSDSDFNEVGDFNLIPLHSTWCTVPIINYVSGCQYQKVDMPQEVYDTYFAGRDWTEKNLNEQIVVIDDTAYIAYY